MVVALRTRPEVQPRLRAGVAALHHPVRWFTPQPLWRRIPREELPARREQPVLLRFAGDDFMDELLALLATEPLGDLGSYVAQPETWRDPDVGLDETGRDKPGQLKLYQPSHNRFYLVTGALACRIPGVPDRTVDTAVGESVFFVLRRLHEGDEYAWSTSQSNKGWFQLASPDTTVLPDEERHPLFPIGFTLDGVPRRLFAGLVPVASRDTYCAEGTLNPLPSSEEAALPGGDPRPTLFEQQVTASLQGLHDWYRALTTAAGPGVTDADRRLIDRTSVYTLLDLMGALRAHVRPLYDAIMNPGAPVPPLGGALGLAFLIAFTAAGGRSLVDVLRSLEQDREQIEVLGPDDNLDPDWVFPFVGPDRDFSMWLDEIEATITVPQRGGGTRSEVIRGPTIQVLFHQALSQPYVPENEPSNVADPVAMVSTTLETPKLDPQGDATYVLRLVYERPQCVPPHPPLISQPSRAFVPAPFFDPDAPVRPLRIQMPVDTSTEGLRKFDRGVAFLLSNQLRAQMARVSGLKDLMAGQVGEEKGLDLGLICSFSIPIITICALILLMIMVQLLNIVFWWLPFFKICLPLRLRR